MANKEEKVEAVPKFIKIKNDIIKIEDINSVYLEDLGMGCYYINISVKNSNKIFRYYKSSLEDAKNMLEKIGDTIGPTLEI